MALLTQYPLSVLVISLSLIILFIIITKRRRTTRHGLPLPPIPPGWPLIGNLPDLAKYGGRKEVHLLMEKWARQYGDIFGVQVGPVTEYFLNSDQAVKVGEQSVSTREQSYQDAHLYVLGTAGQSFGFDVRTTTLDRI